jgi:hypothetical protein
MMKGMTVVKSQRSFLSRRSRRRHRLDHGVQAHHPVRQGRRRRTRAHAGGTEGTEPPLGEVKDGTLAVVARDDEGDDGGQEPEAVTVWTMACKRTIQSVKAAVVGLVPTPEERTAQQFAKEQARSGTGYHLSSPDQDNSCGHC